MRVICSGLLFPTEEQIPLLGNQDAVEEANKGSLKPRSVAREDYGGAKSTPNVNSTLQDEVPVDSSISTLYGGSDPDQQLRPLDKHKEVNIIVEPHQGPHAASSSKARGDVVMASNCSDVPFDNVNDENEPVDYEPDSSFCGNSCFDSNPSELKNISNNVLPDTAPILEELQDFTEDEFKNTTTSSVSENEKLESRSQLENVTEQMAFDRELIDPEVNSFSTATVTRSDQICRIDLLEDSINDAKNNKVLLIQYHFIFFSILE